MDDHTDTLALGERQQLVLDVPRDQRVGGCSVSTGAICWICRSWATLKLETPI
jgi:hypothetical protein